MSGISKNKFPRCGYTLILRYWFFTMVSIALLRYILSCMAQDDLHCDLNMILVVQTLCSKYCYFSKARKSEHRNIPSSYCRVVFLYTWSIDKVLLWSILDLMRCADFLWWLGLKSWSKSLWYSRLFHILSCIADGSSWSDSFFCPYDWAYRVW